MSGKYMAYVGSYSYTGKAKGITVFDVDVENGMFKERCEIEVDNSSYVIASSDGKTLPMKRINMYSFPVITMERLRY